MSSPHPSTSQSSAGLRDKRPWKFESCQMSNVQCPTSAVNGPDIGRWTLDFGRFRSMAEGLATTHEHAAHPGLQHHFENMEQQREAGTLGMWVFLVTEIMFFGGMFLAYTIYRWLYPEAFASASNHLSLPLGAINTGVLIFSSFTMAMAVFSAQTGRQ